MGNVTRCSVAGCENPGPYSRGWCKKHWQQWHRTGSPLPLPPLPHPSLPGERWLPVPGYPDYEVSDLGRVWSYSRDARGRLMKQSPNSRYGYPMVDLWVSGSRKRRAVHVFLAAAFIGPCPEGQEVRHLDGNPAHCVLSNLTYGTHAENMLDTQEHGTHNNGRKTHCDNDHEFTPGNTILTTTARGGVMRTCLTCKRARNRAYMNAPAPDRDPISCKTCGQQFQPSRNMKIGGSYSCETCRPARKPHRLKDAQA